MITDLINLFTTSNFLPHGYCLVWNSPLLWFHVIAECLIFISYIIIPSTIFWILHKYKNINYRNIFKWFAIFILSCGFTHLMGIIVIWFPVYWIQVLFDIVCAGISLYVAYGLIKIAPNIILYTKAYSRNLIEASLDPLLTIGPTGKILDLNQSAVIIFGEPRDKLLGSNFYDYCSFPEKVQKDYQHVFAHGTITDYPIIVINKNTQEPRTILCNATHYIDTENIINGVVIAAKDITRLQIIEQKLIQTNAFLEISENKFHTIFQSSADALILEDNNIFIDCNPATLKIFDCSNKFDIIGQNIFKFFKEQNGTDNLSTYCKNSLLGEIQRFEWICIKANKAEFFADIVMATIMLDNKQLLHISIRDLTDTKKYQKEIEQHAAQLQQTFLQTVHLITELNELRDPYTVGHEQRVAELAVAIGQELNLSQDQLIGLRVSGYLHDIGKIAIPIEILTKPGKLTKLELDFIQTHSENGYNILKNIDFPWNVALVAYQHHERLDGSGYPNGVKDKDIILEARIVAVADIMESMLSHRPYRPGLGMEAALNELIQGRGILYDPIIVDICINLFKKQHFTFPQIQSTKLLI